MKSIIPFLFVSFLSFCGFGQIQINHNDMPQVDDTIRYSLALSTGGVDYEATGENYTWDFSGLNAFAQQLDTFVSFASTPILYRIVFFGSSNLAMPLNEFDWISGFEISDTYRFFNNSNSDFREVGFAVTAMNIPIPVKYNKPDVWYMFPLQYNQVDSSGSNYGINIPELAYIGGWKQRKNQVDGWGTLITPYGQFETLRVKTNILQYDSIYLDTLGTGIPLMRNITEYKWLGKNRGLPLLTISEEGLITTVHYLDSIRGPSSGIENQKFDGAYSISPNPALTYFDLNRQQNQKGAAIHIFVYDGIGRLVHTCIWQEGQHTIRIGTSNWKKGEYLIAVVRSNRLVYSGKVLIS